MKLLRRKELSIYTVIFFFISAVFEITIRKMDLYNSFPNIDVISHILWGISFAFLVILLMIDYKLKDYYLYLIMLGLGVLWEIWEDIGDRLMSQPTYMLDFFWWDGFFDIVFFAVGSIIAYLYLKWMEIIK